MDYRPPSQGGPSASSHRIALAGVFADSAGIPSGPMRLKLLTDKIEGECTKSNEGELPSRPINVR